MSTSLRSFLPSRCWRLLFLLLSSTVHALPYLSHHQLPPHAPWQTIDATTQFLSADAASRAFRKQSTRRLEEENNVFQEYGSDNAEEAEEPESSYQYQVTPFIEGVSDYDAYQQAWRMLGFMIDCDNEYSDDDGNNNNNSHDSNDGESTGEGCQRYVVWAAYVDLDYQGGGIGEYQFWNHQRQAWDQTACAYTQSERCAKVDCHEEGSNYRLLGFFKHASYDDWFEQLFKHEGFCVWNAVQDASVYNFMSNAREQWPQGCMISGTYDEDGNSIQYDIKPLSNGKITLGLYTDTRCIVEYQSKGSDDPITIENVIGNVLSDNDGSGDGNDDAALQYDTLEESLAAWDAGLDSFAICQPCVAYDILNYGYGYNDDTYRGANYYYANGDDGNNGGGGGDDFDCYDDADYTNVNQCMKFMAKTVMKTATFRDMALANAQGTLTDTPLAAYRHAARHRALLAVCVYIGFLFAGCCLCTGARKFLRVKKETNYQPNWKQPLGSWTTANKSGIMA